MRTLRAEQLSELWRGMLDSGIIWSQRLCSSLWFYRVPQAQGEEWQLLGQGHLLVLRDLFRHPPALTRDKAIPPLWVPFPFLVYPALAQEQLPVGNVYTWFSHRGQLHPLFSPLRLRGWPVWSIQRTAVPTFLSTLVIHLNIPGK